MDLYTIGHSRHPIDKFIQLLVGHRIEVLADVRSTPFSRFNPQFNKNALQQALEKQHITYIYAGEALGGRPKDPECYKQHAISSKPGDTLNEVDYPEVKKRPWFLNGIQQLLETASLHTTCILCSEEDPAKCHRHHLISSHLMATHPEVNILHIRGDGNLVDAKSILNSPNKPDAEQLSF